MQLWRDQLQQHQHRYPHDVNTIEEEFGPQLDWVSCGAAAVHHGLLLGGLNIPKSSLQAIFRTYPKPRPDHYGYIDPERLSAGLKSLGFEPEELYRESRESTREFLERVSPELDRGAFAIACIYSYEDTDGEYSHWIVLGRWKDGRIRVVDSAWDPVVYNMTPKTLDYYAWGNRKDGYSVLLVRPGIWQKNYEEWLPGRDRLLKLKTSASMGQCIHTAARALNDNLCAYEQLDFYLSEKVSLAVKVHDGRKHAIAVSTPTDEKVKGQAVVVRRLAEGEEGKPGPSEVVFRMSALRGWQLS